MLRTGATLAGTAALGSLSGRLGVVGKPRRLAYPLERNDPRVRAALVAEERAYEHYGLALFGVSLWVDRGEARSVTLDPQPAGRMFVDGLGMNG